MYLVIILLSFEGFVLFVRYWKFGLQALTTISSSCDTMALCFQVRLVTEANCIPLAWEGPYWLVDVPFSYFEIKRPLQSMERIGKLQKYDVQQYVSSEVLDTLME